MVQGGRAVVHGGRAVVQGRWCRDGVKLTFARSLQVDDQQHRDDSEGAT